jgi:enoyl-[acyl-carrier protein] reductase I
MGLANRKSIAWHVGQLLENEGAQVLYGVRSESRLASLKNLLADRPAYVCDVEDEAQVAALGHTIAAHHQVVHGVVHSIAFANYSAGMRPFHETQRHDFLQAVSISSFSLVEIARALKPVLAKDASVVTMSISSQVTAESYGYMAPIKACLESSVRFLAKSFSADSEVRFNAVCSGPLKTSASAGIPGYLENYLFAEKLTFRKRALKTEEVAATTAFLLSPRSSGINGQGIIVNAGMDCNYFDTQVVHLATKAQ